MYRTLKYIVLFICLIFSGLAIAQLSITGEGFPVAGDTFLISTDHLPYHVKIGSPGGNQLWDFTKLQSAYALRSYVLPFENRTGIPGLDDAEAVFSGMPDGVDLYVVFTEKGIAEVGRRMTHPLLNGQWLNAYFETPKPYYSQFEYQEQSSGNYRLIAPLNLEELSVHISQDWARGLNGARIIWDIDMEYHIDAWGQLQVPYGRYQSLRQNVKEIAIPIIEVDSGDGQWKSVTELGIDAPQIPDMDRHHYYYWTEELNHPPVIAEVFPGTDQVTQVYYKAFDFNSRVIDRAPARAEVIAYPNPAFDIVRFDLMNLPKGVYRLEIFNILGVNIISREIYADGYTTAEYDFSMLKKGSYIYRVINEHNRTITSKRLVIIQP